jgi:hypothetical protein
MNHLFLELQAREKIEKYHREGMESQLLRQEAENRPQRFASLRQAVRRLFDRRGSAAPVLGELTERLG